MKLLRRLTRARGANQNKIQPDFPDTLRRLNHLVRQLQLNRYLEVGLGNGGTFDGVRAKFKVGVDPHPWNPEVRHLDNVQICTSDEYFRQHWDRGLKYDLILLDGLHTADQTYRDFVNSLHFAHEKTVWVIDDVVPNDVYSANPDSVEAIKQRRAATGSEDCSWHGDVYKVVWMIRTFHPNMTLLTFWPKQPQALVYFGAPTSAQPVMNTTLKDIAALTYEDTVARRSDYNMGEEAEILQACIVAQRR
jgi:hypothetical protein